MRALARRNVAIGTGHKQTSTCSNEAHLSRKIAGVQMFTERPLVIGFGGSGVDEEVLLRLVSLHHRADDFRGPELPPASCRGLPSVP